MTWRSWSRSRLCRAGTCKSWELSSARWPLASASKGFSFPLRRARARCGTVATGSCSREIDIVFHLPVKVEGVQGVLQGGERLGEGVEADASLLVQGAQAVVERAEGEGRV